MIDLKDKRTLVTGGSSMIGSAITYHLEQKGAIVDQALHRYYNLLSLSDTQRLFNEFKPDYVVHAAGWNGGIEWNKKFPADIFYRTAEMGLNVLNCCNDFNVKKVVSLISSCALPDRGEEVLAEENLWNGSPNTSVECHGLSKRMLHAYSRQLYKQFGLNAVCSIVTNSYGEKDSFHPLKTKVVAALIRKVVEAHKFNTPEIVCWGSGSPRRELMYAQDVGNAIVQVLESYDDVNTPINIGTGQDISIKELVGLIVEIVDYKGNIIWDTSKADGQMRKLLNSSKMRRLLDVSITPTKIGLKNTIEWYINNKDEADAKY